MPRDVRDFGVKDFVPDIVSRKKPYLHLQYIQARNFCHIQSFNIARREVDGFNIVRVIEKDNNRVFGADSADHLVGLIPKTISLWIRPNNQGEKGILGVLLVDPSIVEGNSLCGSHDYLTAPPPFELSLPQAPPRISFFDDVVLGLSLMNSEEIKIAHADPRTLLKKPLYIVCFE